MLYESDERPEVESASDYVVVDEIDHTKSPSAGSSSAGGSVSRSWALLTEQEEEARMATESDKSYAGLTDRSAGFPSPTAQSEPDLNPRKRTVSPNT